MGLMDRLKGLFKRGGKEEKKVQETYVLKVKTPKGGWRKFREFDQFVTPDEVIDELPPGIYRLDVHREGQRGFEVAWGPIAAYDTEEELEEMGIEGESRRPRKRALEGGVGALETLIDELDKQAQVMEKLGELGLKLARFSGQPVVPLEPGKTYEDMIIDGLMKMRQKYEELDKIFGTSKLKGSEAELPIEGKIPAWAVYAPRLLTQMLDSVEMRLYKWGLLGESSSTPGYRQTAPVGGVSDFPDIESYKRKYEVRQWERPAGIEEYRPRVETTEHRIQETSEREYKVVEPELIEEPGETKVKIEKKEKIVDEESLQVDEVDIEEEKQIVEDKSIKELLEELEEEEETNG